MGIKIVDNFTNDKNTKCWIAPENIKFKNLFELVLLDVTCIDVEVIRGPQTNRIQNAEAIIWGNWFQIIDNKHNYISPASENSRVTAWHLLGERTVELTTDSQVRWRINEAYDFLTNLILSSIYERYDSSTFTSEYLVLKSLVDNINTIYSDKIDNYSFYSAYNIVNKIITGIIQDIYNSQVNLIKSFVFPRINKRKLTNLLIV